MKFQELLDHLVVPRANGSEGLRETAAFIHTTLQTHTSEIELQTFSATPYGTQLLMASIFGGTASALFAVYVGVSGFIRALEVTPSHAFR